MESIIGNALTLHNSGAQSAVEILNANAAQFNLGTSDFTISIWYQSRGEGTLFSLISNGTTVLLSLEQTSNGDVKFTLNSVKWSIGQQTCLSDGEWHQLTLTRKVTDSSGTLLFYVDGVLQKSATSNAIAYDINGISKAYFAGTDTGAGIDCILADIQLWTLSKTGSAIREGMYTRLNSTDFVAPKLNGYWNFLNYTTGSAHITDLSHFGTTGSITGGTIETTAIHQPGANYVLFANRESGSVEIPGNAVYNFGANEFTVECWFQTNSGGALASRTEIDHYSNLIGWHLYIDNNGRIAWKLMAEGNSQTFITHETKVTSDGKWHHVAVARKGSDGQIFIYLDGVEQDLLSGNPSYSTANINVTTATPLKIGASTQHDMGDSEGDLIPGDVRGLNLRLDEVRLWNVARSAEDIYQTMLRRLIASENNNLIGYWPFSTRNVIDQSSTQNINTASYEADLVTANVPIRGKEYALSLPSLGSYVKCPVTKPYILGTGNITFSTWMKTTSQFAGGTLFAQSIESRSESGMYVELSQTGEISITFSNGDDDDTHKFPAQTSLIDQNWHYISVVKNSTNVTLYINGVLIKSISTDGTIINIPAAENIFIGADNGGTDCFTGAMSEVRIWSTDLSQRQIQQYQWHSLPGKEMKNLQGYWSFDQRAPIDLSVNDNDGVLIGNAAVIPSPELTLNPPITTMYCNGDDGYATIHHEAVLPTSAFCIQLWIKPEQSNTAQTIFSNTYKASSSNQVNSALHIGLDADNRVVFGQDSTTATITSYTALRIHQWYEITLTYDGTNAILYINGNQETVPVVFNYSTSPSSTWLYTLGANATSSGNTLFFKGAIQTLRMWNVCPSQATIRETLDNILTGNETGLLTYINVDDGDLTDMTGNGHNCQLVNAELRVTDFYNKPTDYALNLSQKTVGQYVSCGTSTALNLTSSITLKAAVKVSTLNNSNTWSVVAAKGTAYMLRINNTTGFANFATAGCEAGITGTTNINDGQWHFLTGVYDSVSNDIKIYVDGVLDNPSSATATPITYSGTSHFSIGAEHSAPATTSLHGFIKEVQIWNKAADADKIALNSNHQLIGTEEHLEGYWPLSASDNSMNDFSNNQNAGLGVNDVGLSYSDLKAIPPRPTIKAQSRLIQTWLDESSLDGTSVYRTVISALRADGTPVIGSRLRVWAVSPKDIYGAQSTSPSPTLDVHPLEIIVDGGTYKVDETQSAGFNTNAMGQVVITTMATELSTFSLKIWADFMDEEDRIIINPDENLHLRLKNVTGASLLADRSASDQPALLPSDKFDSAAANVVANAISNTIQTIDLPQAQMDATRYMYTGEADTITPTATFLKPDVQSQQWDVGTDDIYTRIVEPVADAKNWEVTFGTTGPTSGNGSMASLSMNYYTPEESLIRLSKLGLGNPIVLASHEDLSMISWPSWDDVKSFAIHTYDKAKHAVRVVIDFGSQVVDYVLTQAKHIGQALEGFLNGLLVKYLGIDASAAFKKIMNFFRTMFDWGDIVDTMQVLANLGGQGSGLVVDFLKASNTAVDGALDYVKNNIDHSFTSMINQMGDNTPSGIITQYGNGETSEALLGDSSITNIPEALLKYGVENNWLLHMLFSSSDPNDGSGNTFISPTQEIINTFNELKKKVIKDLDDPKAIAAFRDMIHYFEQIFSNPHNFVQLAIKGFLSAAKAMGLFAIDLAKVVIDTLFSLFELIFKLMTSTFNQHVNIPLITWLFEQKIMGGNGTKLTPLNLCALLAAIPVTIVSKFVDKENEAPFKDFSYLKTYKIKMNLPWAPPQLHNESEVLENSVDISPVDLKKLGYKLGISYTVLWGVWSVIDVASDVKSTGDPYHFNNGRGSVNQDAFNSLGVNILTVGIPVIGNVIGAPGVMFHDVSWKSSIVLDTTLWILKFVGPGLDSVAIKQLNNYSGINANQLVDLEEKLIRANEEAKSTGEAKVVVVSCLGGVLVILSVMVMAFEFSEDKTPNGHYPHQEDILLKFFQNIGEATPVLMKFLAIIDDPRAKIALIATDVVGDGLALTMSGIRTANSKP